MIIYLAGLQMVDTTLLEAADIDGATWFQKFRNVTFPMVIGLHKFLYLTSICR